MRLLILLQGGVLLLVMMAAPSHGVGRGSELQDQGEAETYYQKGLADYKSGHYKEAAALFRRAVTLKPTASAMHYNLGMAYIQLGQFLEAIKAFREAVRLNPHDAAAHSKLGVMYEYFGHYREAIESLQQAIRLKPGSANDYHNLGVAYYRTGQHPKAVEAFKQAIRLAPNLAVTHLILSDAYQKLNRPAEAAEAQRQADRLGLHETTGVNAILLAADEPQAPDPASLLQVNFNFQRRSWMMAAKDDGANGERGSHTEDGTLARERWSEGKDAVRESEAKQEEKTGKTIAQSPTASAAHTTAPGQPKTAAAISDASLKPDLASVPNIAPAKSEPGPNASAAAEPASAASLTTVYRVGAGDVLDIRLLNSTLRDSTLYTVLAGGWVEYPLAGEPTQVAGLTTSEIEARLAAKIKLYDKPRVVVGVREYASHTVIVSGLVNDPGTKILRREAVPLYVVVADAQPRNEADGAFIFSPTTGRRTMVDFSDPEAMNVLVRPGDVVTVQARPQQFLYVGGAINQPGEKTFRPGMTLTQAILAAGGVSRSAGNFVEVTRQGENERLTMNKYNLKNIKLGKEPDPRLQPGDRIEVSH